MLIHKIQAFLEYLALKVQFDSDKTEHYTLQILH